MRHVFFAVLLFGAYFVRPRLIPHKPSSAGFLQPPLLAIGSQADQLLQRLRAISLQRMSILHHAPLRAKVSPHPLLCMWRCSSGGSFADTAPVDPFLDCLQVSAFWAKAEQESEWARADGEVEGAMAKRQGGGEAAEFRRWIDGAMAGVAGMPANEEPGPVA